jgi:GH24 family phage-related lysozyme (muramidase)
MYLDVKGLVTVGIGNLIDPSVVAQALPFVHNDSKAPALPQEILTGWNTVKQRQDLRFRSFHVFAQLCSLRLPDTAIDALVTTQLEKNVRLLGNTFPGWETWPADAQLGIASMAWAMGAGFPAHWPRFTTACRALDFEAASRECRMKEQGNPGLIARNNANQRLFLNAAKVVSQGLPADQLLETNGVDDDPTNPPLPSE